MTWSYRIARVAGIDIKVHVTFVLILALFGWQWGQTGGTAGTVFGIVLALALFACVTLHELGHSLVAQRFGVPVREIVLLPLGGVALMSRLPDKPRQELLIALAGPLVNVVLGIVLLPLVVWAATSAGLDATGLVEGLRTPSAATFLAWLFWANVMLVLFNMIPAFPLDGGRILRAVLAMRMSYPRATAIASSVGQFFALIFGVIGVVSGNFLLVLVAVFVFFGAGQENAVTQARTHLSTLRVGDAYNRHVLTLRAGDDLGRVVDYILTSYQPDFAVMFGTNLLGVVTRENVLRALPQVGPETPVTQLMERDVLRVPAAANLEEVREALGGSGRRIAAVYRDEEYLGLISREDIAEAFAVLAASPRRPDDLRASLSAG